MALDRAGREVQAAGDLLVGQPLAEQAEDLELAGGDAQRPQRAGARRSVRLARRGTGAPALRSSDRHADASRSSPCVVEERQRLPEPGHRVAPAVGQRGLGDQPGPRCRNHGERPQVPRPPCRRAPARPRRRPPGRRRRPPRSGGSPGPGSAPALPASLGASRGASPSTDEHGPEPCRRPGGLVADAPRHDTSGASELVAGGRRRSSSTNASKARANAAR